MSKRALIVGTNQTAVARDTRRQNSCQPPLYVLAAQDAPPKLGEIELWADVRLCPSPKRVKFGSPDAHPEGLLCPREQTSSDHPAKSVSCQNRK
jgi:hypothetical protein